MCVFIGTGSVLKIQEMLHICSESFKPEDVGEGGGGKEGGEGGEDRAKPADTGSSKTGGKAKNGKDKNEGVCCILRFHENLGIFWMLIL